MPNDRDYLNGDNAPADFTRRRVARILRRERPLYENGDHTQRRFFQEYTRLHDRSRDAFGIVEVGKLKVITYNLIGKIRTDRIISLTEFPLPPWFIRKADNSNMYSRFTPLKPADFTHGRVRKERPKYQPGYGGRWEGIKVLGKIHACSKDRFGVIQIGTLRVFTNNLFGKIKTYRVIPMDTVPFPQTWLLKKLANSNLRSRFLTPPCGR
jgi:hypothetical protein